MSKYPETCRTWLQTARGKPQDVLKLEEAAPVPKPAAGEVLIQVHYAALNPVGYKLMGMVPWPLIKLPMIPEQDFSGRVVNGNIDVKGGDEVLGITPVPVKMKTGKGAMSEYITVESKNLIIRPPSVPSTQAAGLATVGLTAYQALHQPDYPLKPGQRVFINGGSSSVGIVAIQVAKLRGAGWVGTSCSEEKEGMVRELGADEVFDYKAAPLPEQLSKLPQPVDLFVDTIGNPSLFSASSSYLSPSGLFVSISADVSGGMMSAAKTSFGTAKALLLPKVVSGRLFRMIGLKNEKADLQQLVDWMAEGKLKILIDSTHKSDREGVMAAYEKMMSGRAKGKILVQMGDEEAK